MTYFNLKSCFLAAALCLLHSATSFAVDQFKSAYDDPNSAIAPGTGDNHFQSVEESRAADQTPRRAGRRTDRKGSALALYGRDVESFCTFQVLKKSDDDGETWSEVKLMILPPRTVRTMSPTLWIDPQGRLWLFWGQAFGLQDARYGIFAIMTDEPDAEDPKWSEPRRIGDGVMLNKPTALSNGDWLLVSSIWKTDDSIRVYASTDQGKTFALRGTANIADPKTRGPDEPMIVERKDGTLWMLVRNRGLAQTVSSDRGKTWSAVEPSGITHPTTRFFVRRLNSGALLLVKHGGINERVGREKLMAFVSDDDGLTWQGGLMLDERDDVTYPDGVQASDGTIYVMYDYSRTPEGVVLMSTFTEDDVRAGKPVSDKIRMQHVVDRLPVVESTQIEPAE